MNIKSNKIIREILSDVDKRLNILHKIDQFHDNISNIHTIFIKNNINQLKELLAGTDDEREELYSLLLLNKTQLTDKLEWLLTNLNVKIAELEEVRDIIKRTIDDLNK